MRVAPSSWPWPQPGAGGHRPPALLPPLAPGLQASWVPQAPFSSCSPAQPSALSPACGARREAPHLPGAASSLQRGFQMSRWPEARAFWVGTTLAMFLQQPGGQLVHSAGPALTCRAPHLQHPSPHLGSPEHGGGEQEARGEGGSWGELSAHSGGTPGADGCWPPGLHTGSPLLQALHGRAGAVPAGLLALASLVPDPPALLRLPLPSHWQWGGWCPLTVS